LETHSKEYKRLKVSRYDLRGHGLHTALSTQGERRHYSEKITMEPELPKWQSRATFVDLLDRVLDRGLFLRADLIISVAGIPLIGATLSVAVAGMETMLKYGIMTEFDDELRASPNKLCRRLYQQQPAEEMTAV